MAYLSSPLKRFWRDTQGNATLEFVTIFPFIAVIFFMFAEIGILTGRTALMKRGVAIAVRDVRIGVNRLQDDALASFRQTVCQNAFVIVSCLDDLRVDMQEIDPNNPRGVGDRNICENRADPNLSPAVGYDNGREGSVIVVRTCLIVDPVFPIVPELAGLDYSYFENGYAIVVTSAFQNECTDLEACS